ncbi:MAG: delta-60 repeat domain-containing protein [Xanthomonadales bacterium]|nr:delta-60 repeat domain-containing protein [Xanthomonadales bacterium]
MRTNRHFLRCIWLSMLANAPLQAQSALDGFAPTVSGGSVLAVARQADGKILLGGDFNAVDGVSGRAIARLHPDGRVDSSFHSPLTQGAVNELLVDENGDILLGGSGIVALDEAAPGAIVTLSVGALARLDSSGDLDGSFLPIPTGTVHALLSRNGVNYLVGGEFSAVAGQPRLNLDLIHESGVSNPFAISTQANGTVFALDELPDGRVLVGGSFTQLGGQTAQRIGRLLSSGARDTSFSASVDGTVLDILTTNDGNSVIAGSFLTVNGVSRSHIARLSPEGVLDGDFQVALDQQVFALAALADGRVIAGGDFSGGFTPRIMAINTLGQLSTFPPSGASQSVRALLTLPDDSVLVGGKFASLGGVTRSGIGRVEAHGQLDTTFGPVHDGSVITAAVHMPDRHWLVAGDFVVFDGLPRQNLARVDSRGRVTIPVFGASNPNLNGVPLAMAALADGRAVIAGDFTSAYGQGAGNLIRVNADLSGRDSFAQFPAQTDGPIRALAVQADGKILLGGDFTQVNGVSRLGIARLNASGTLDSAFNANMAAGSSVRALAVSAAGEIFVGGSFTTVGGIARNHLVKLNTTGGVDAIFNPAPNARVDTLLLAPDGGVWVGGEFTSIVSTSRVRVARITGTGGLDSSFNANLSAASVARVQAVALQADGRVWIGGTAGFLSRRLASGATDFSFSASANGSITGILLGLDGKALITGSFSTLAGLGRSGIGRLVAVDRAADQAAFYQPQLSKFFWSLSGSASEVLAPPMFSVMIDAQGTLFTTPVAMVRAGAQWSTSVLFPLDSQVVVRIQARVAGGPAGAADSRIETRHLIVVRSTLFANGFE